MPDDELVGAIAAAEAEADDDAGERGGKLNARDERDELSVLEVPVCVDWAVLGCWTDTPCACKMECTEW